MTTTTQETASSVIEVLETRLGGEAISQLLRGRKISCPLHGGSDPNFSINREHTVATCWSVCGAFNAYNLRGAFAGESAYMPPVPRTSPAKTRRAPLQGATLDQLVQAKKGAFTHEYLESIGWRDITWGHSKRPVIEIPIKSMDGTPLRKRYRVGIDGTPKMLSEKGKTLWPIGADNLAVAQKAGWIILEEGETDYAALSYRGIPAMGIPGVNTWKPEWSILLAKIPVVYVWQEPGKPNEHTGLTPGETMLRDITESMGDSKGIYTITPPAGFKDPCELAQVYGDKLPGLIDELRAAAELQIPGKIMQELYSVLLCSSCMISGDLQANSDDPPDPPTHSPITGLLLDRPKTIVEHNNQLDSHKLLAKHFRLQKQFREDHPEYLMQELHSMSMWLMHDFSYGLNFENPNITPASKDLAMWLTYADGEFAKQNPLTDTGFPRRNPKVTAQENCLQSGGKYCDVHDRQHSAVWQCSMKQDPNCGSSLSRQLDRIRLPVPEGDAAYRHVWLCKQVNLTRDAIHNAHIINQECKLILKLAGSKLQTRLRQRKGAQGSQLLYRAVGFHMDLPTSTINLKLVFWESFSGALDKDITKLEAAWGGKLTWDDRDRDAERTQLFMVSNHTATLFSLDPDSQLSDNQRAELFAAYWDGTKSQKLNYSLGLVADLLADLPEPGKDLCKVEVEGVGCGLELHWKPDEPGISYHGNTPADSDNYAAELAYTKARG